MRFFNKRQKKILTLLGGNICQICKKIINQDAHADHKIPYAKKGKTILQNSFKDNNNSIFFISKNSI